MVGRRFRTAAVIAVAWIGVLTAVAPGSRADETPPPVEVVEPPAAEPPADPAAVPAIEPPAAPVALVGSPLPLREGSSGWRVRTAQSRLGWLGYSIAAPDRRDQRMGRSTVAAVRAFQSKFGFRPTGVVGAGTWDLLGQISGRVGVLPQKCRSTTAICIDKRQRLVRLVVKGRPVLTMDARFGFVGAETREGVYRVHRKSRDHWSSLYGTWMPFALFFSGGQAVHYSPYFKRDGYNGGSHGCVNLRDYAGARRLFDRVPLGTRVVVYRT